MAAGTCTCSKARPVWSSIPKDVDGRLLAAVRVDSIPSSECSRGKPENSHASNDPDG
jgi:hypothetical protein